MRILIAGAGIGGLTAALTLHAAGFDDVRIHEAAEELSPLGVGLNLLPHAVGELAALGLLDPLQERAVATRELLLCTTKGDLVWREPRGLWAGHDHPQLSVHRADLQAVLLAAVLDRLGPEAVTLGTKVTSTAHDADLLIGADGLHSVVRKGVAPDEGPPLTNGITMWRGTSRVEPYLTGASMVVAGDDRSRLVLYPIRRDGGKVLLNWVAARPCPDPDDRGLDDVLENFGDWRLPWLDVRATLEKAYEVHRYPMADREPLDRWSTPTTTLLGDAAHPMYPTGSNGATQAILDARALADSLRTTGDTKRYEAERRPVAAEIQRANRRMGPEVAITLAHQRAPEPVPYAELAEISAHYNALSARTGVS